MAEPAFVLRVAGFLTLLVTAGWMAARVERRGVDLFAALWWGLAITSVAGVVLARAGLFSLTALGAAVGTVGMLAAVIGRARGPVSSVPARRDNASPWVSRFAAIAATATFVWCWPPFETFMAASDSTMYVDAGIHLARTGAYQVSDTVTPLVPAAAARLLYASVGLFDQGPYIRLPGGLLMPTRDATSATPAFFPLLSTWTGIMAALGGPGFAPAIAPLGMGLAVGALALFAGEAFGLAVAVPTALIFAANFAVWWFGRFAMSEPLTIAFLWGALVFLGRGVPVGAGVMLGLAGLARAETLLFAAAALACWSVWTPVRGRDLIAVGAGALAATALATAGLLAAPNHHVAYLINDLRMTRTAAVVRLLPALWDGRLLSTLVLLPLVPLTVGVAAAVREAPIVRATLRVLVVLTVVVATMVYLRIGGKAEPIRHLGWLATSMSPLGFVLAVGGLAAIWMRGGPSARLLVILVLLVAAVFVPTPRVTGYQPWAMRRFLPVLLPALALGAGMLIGALARSRRRAVQILAALTLFAVVGQQLRPVFAVRRSNYFAGSLDGVRSIAEVIPAGAVVVVDASFADLQVQVPLWLVYERETIMAKGEGFAWRMLLPALMASGRPVYWIQNGFAPAPHAEGLTFTAVGPGQDLTIELPDSPGNVPPSFVIRKVVRFGIYRLAASAGEGGA